MYDFNTIILREIRDVPVLEFNIEFYIKSCVFLGCRDVFMDLKREGARGDIHAQRPRVSRLRCF